MEHWINVIYVKIQMIFTSFFLFVGVCVCIHLIDVTWSSLRRIPATSARKRLQKNEISRERYSNLNLNLLRLLRLLKNENIAIKHRWIR